MGFYGEISNSAKTNISFDKIYPNRKTMEENMTSDGIYVGRFVLIEYDDATTIWRQAYTNDNVTNLISTILYSDTSCTIPYQATPDVIGETYGIQKGDIVFVANDTTGYYDYFECIGAEIDGKALFTFLKVSDQIVQDSSYIVNYNIDKKHYANAIGRGWDSTMWQKVYDNGVEKYVMIAELNSVVPTFSLEADPPTSTPIVPHFDSNSNNMFYTLHWQPNWGLRVKSSQRYETPLLDVNGKQLQQTTESCHSVGSTAYQNLGTIPSDINIKWSKTSLGADGALHNTWFKLEDGSSTKGEWTDNPALATSIPAAIYFNKDGFNPAEINYSPGFDPNKFVYTSDGTNNANNTVTDMIVVEPTGRSGLIYQTHDNNNYEASEDIQEFSMMLPTLGNVIAKAWDMIYCDSQQANKVVDEDGNTHLMRKTDYSWKDGTDPTRNGAHLFEVDGKTGLPIYNQIGSNSIAGCINSVHDLMGMIVVNSGENLPDIDNADENKIYYIKQSNYGYDQGYYRKKLSYEWDTENLNSFESIILQEYDPTEKYYFKEGVNYTLAKNGSDKRKYYYFENFEKDLVPVDLDAAFEQNRYYYKDTSTGYTKYILYKGLEPQAGVQYYEITPGETLYQRFFKPGVYYYFNSVGQPVPDENDAPTKGRTYFTRKITQDPETLSFTYTYDPVHDPLYFFDPVNDPLFVLENETYVHLTSAPDTVVPCFRLTISSDNTNFYAKNTFYYQDESGNLIYCGDNEYDDTIDYYQMVKHPIEVPNKFYQPDVYYWEVTDDNFIIDVKDTITEGRIYYTKGNIYVKEDQLGIIASGAIWHGDIKNPPQNITLATKRNKYVMEKMPEFASTLNTLNGLILKMNTMLEFGDDTIRDNNTLQGCINTLKDIINKFTNLDSGDLMVVDSYGRLYGAKITDDSWINFSVNNEDAQSSVSISHSSSGVTQGTYGESASKKIDFGNNFIAPKITVDTAGHITSIDNISLEIPNVSESILTNYTFNAEIQARGDIQNTDTINQAFAKLMAENKYLLSQINDLQSKVVALELKHQ